MPDVERAPRVTMAAPMLIRRAGDAEWRRATTINISMTGLLLQTAGLFLEPHTPVEVAVTLPSSGNVTPSRIVGHGRIVRSLTPASLDDDPVMAAHLHECRVEPQVGPDFDALLAN